MTKDKRADTLLSEARAYAMTLYADKMHVLGLEGAERKLVCEGIANAWLEGRRVVIAELLGEPT
jgi:hypothetical protein